MNNKFRIDSFKTSFFFLALFFTLTSCEKEKDLQADETKLRDLYLTENNITVAPTQSGLYYIETLEGTDIIPTTGQYVTIVFESRFLDGEILASDTAEFEFGVGVVIPGIDEALSYMKNGGKATIIVPSQLAYGELGSGNIPPYTTIVYDIELIDVFDKQEREIELRDQYLIDNEITTEPTSSGLYYIETLEGTGSAPTNGQFVEVKYEGRFLSGEVFDSGIFEFQLGAGTVIAGFDEGVSYMKKDGKATLIIPSDLAYGKQGKSDIPAYTTLIFDVEIINIR